MSKTILIFARCVNEDALGDFSLAGTIAKDLVKELGDSPIQVILTSTATRLDKFERLYGKPDSGFVSIEGQRVGICALELFDSVQHEVIAFIEANRCSYASADLVKRVLSPSSKFLFIGAANQSPITRYSERVSMYTVFEYEQPGIYNHFSFDDIHFGVAGFGPDRLGFPTLKKADQLASLTQEQSLNIPSGDYGFMYLAHIKKSDYKLMAQYITLSSLGQYVLVGDYANNKVRTSQAISQELPFNLALPLIQFHPSLDHNVMRKVVSQSTGDLVLSTGVMSAVEAMYDGKLSFYQDLPNNVNFVASYLLAIKSLCTDDDSLFGSLPNLIIELSTMLFAPKPLRSEQMNRTRELLGLSSVTSRLIDANQLIIHKANGTMATHLLSFIGAPAHTALKQQCATVCLSLRKEGEIAPPVYDRALRRAAAWGRLFELKVLLKVMPAEDISKQDVNGALFSALHWAALQKHYECASLLVKAGACVDVQDSAGKTPLHYAVSKADKKIIKLLIEMGASVAVADSHGSKPCDGAETWVSTFVNACISSGSRSAHQR